MNRNKSVSLLLALLVCFGCKSSKHQAKMEQKKIDKAKAVFAAHPLDFAADCGRQFPVRSFDSTVIDQIIKKGATKDPVKSSVNVDVTNEVIELLKRSNDTTLSKIIDSLRQHPFTIKADCPPVAQEDPDTVFTIREHYQQVANTATEQALTKDKEMLIGKCSAADQKISTLSEANKSKDKWIVKLAIGDGLFFLMLIIAVVLFIKGKFSFL